MTKLSENELIEFRKITIRIRKSTSDIEHLPDQVIYRESYRETLLNLYQQLCRFVQNHSEFSEDFKDIPIDTGNSNPLTFESGFKQLRAFTDVIEDSITYQNPTDPPKEFIILPGQAFTASTIIESILKSATDEIKIIDNYLSNDSVKVLETANNQRNIKIITRKSSKDFISAIEIMRKGWKGSIEIRDSSSFHDRLIILDNTLVWLCGPSLDYLGVKKPGVIVQIENLLVSKTLIELFEKEWSSASFIL